MSKRILYKTADGKRVPSVTTILSRFKDSGGLIYWANQQGLDGLTLDEARIPAASAGTLAHDMVEAHLNEWPEPDMPQDEAIAKQARAAFEMYLTWQDQSRIKVIHTEVSLVSEIYSFGGRLDAIGRSPDGTLTLVDWKTGGIYVDHLFQVAAYTMLWNENYTEQPITGGAHICSFKRETGDFSHHYFGNLDREIEAFITMRYLYDRVKEAQRRV